jgi:hypothetical protein
MGRESRERRARLERSQSSAHGPDLISTLTDTRPMAPHFGIARHFAMSVLNPAMSRRTLQLSFLIALGGACAGCATTPPEMQPVGKAMVRVVREENPTQAAVQLANEVIVILPPPLAGHEWQIIQHNPATLRQLTDVVPSAEGTGEFSVSFMAVRLTQGESGARGATRLMFALVPSPNPTGAQPADVREIQLTVE